jgi:hypothetical protein
MHGVQGALRAGTLANCQTVLRESSLASCVELPEFA